FGHGAADFRTQYGTAVDAADQPAQPQLVAAAFGITGDGHLTTALQATVQRPLGQHTAGSDVIMQGFNQFLNRTVVIVITHAPLNTQRALTTGRQGLFGGNKRCNTILHFHAQQAGGGQNNGVELTGIQLAQPGLDVAAQAFDDQIGALLLDLTLAAQAGSAHHRALRQLFNGFIAVGDKGILRVFTRTDYPQFQPFRELHRYVFHGMHGDVGAAIQHGGFQLFYEQAFAADFGQRHIQNFVALSGEGNQLNRQLRVQRQQTRFDVFSLPHGKRAFAGGDAERGYSRHG